MIEIQELAEVFVAVADTLVPDFDINDFLHALSVQAADLTNTDAVVLLGDADNVLHFMGSSSTDSLTMDAFQMHDNCLRAEAFRTGERVVEPDMSAAINRWPVCAANANVAGIGWVIAFPMKLRHQVIGVLTVCGDGDTPLTTTDVEVVQSLADLATIAITQAKVSQKDRVLNTQLQDALNRRAVIEQAKGALAQASGISVSEAFDRMRRYARSHRMALNDLAHLVMIMPSMVDELNRKGPA